MSKTMNDFIKDDVDTIGEYFRELIVAVIMIFTPFMTYNVITYYYYFLSVIVLRVIFLASIFISNGDAIITIFFLGYFTGLTLYQRYRRKILNANWQNVKFNQKSKLY